MVSSTDFTGSFRSTALVSTEQSNREEHPPGALLLAATAQFRWPPASTFVAAYAQDLMAADTWRNYLSSGPMPLAGDTSWMLLWRARPARLARELSQSAQAAGSGSRVPTAI